MNSAAHDDDDGMFFTQSIRYDEEIAKSLWDLVSLPLDNMWTQSRDEDLGVVRSESVFKDIECTSVHMARGKHPDTLITCYRRGNTVDKDLTNQHNPPNGRCTDPDLANEQNTPNGSFSYFSPTQDKTRPSPQDTLKEYRWKIETFKRKEHDATGRARINDFDRLLDLFESQCKVPVCNRAMAETMHETFRKILLDKWELLQGKGSDSLNLMLESDDSVSSCDTENSTVPMEISCSIPFYVSESESEGDD